MAGKSGPLVLLLLGLTLLGWGAEGRGHGRSQKEVSGASTVYLGQGRDMWVPMIHTKLNMSQISNHVISIKSTFQFRTFDPEGIIFYGDTNNGEDWFVLSLKSGFPLMQIDKEDMVVSVAGGGMKLNDGKWHTLEVSSHGKFVILEVDGMGGMAVGMQTKQTEGIEGDLRLALGGILIDKEKMFVEVEPHMDGCVRDGKWLNISIPWVMEADELWPCYENIQPGSYFPGTGLVIFNISGGNMEMALTFGEEKLGMKSTLNRLRIHFRKDYLKLVQDEDDMKTTEIYNDQASHPKSLTNYKEGRLAIGGLLGEDDDSVGSQFLTGCLKKIKVQGNDLDLDLAAKHVSISSYSCPA
ncbi:sex hormone-binding globulin [Pholidichthys leucotaenia]